MARVMVIEEEPNLRLLLELELADALHHGILVAGRDEAEDALRIEYPDVIILGLGSQMEEGLRTFYWIKCHFPDVSVIVYAARMDLAFTPISRMADAFVLKRSDLEPLMHMLEKLTRRKTGLPIGS